jgi:oligopeptide/dipeptide ABC transporter ATP-binding protein
VLGESGSGKSALLRTILGIQSRHARVSGSALLEGVDLLTMSDREREGVRGRRISMVFQDPMTALDPVFTVGQQLTEGIRRHCRLSRRDAEAKAIHLLEDVQIPSPRQRMNAYPFELSGGMRQRVVIAMALACDPVLLLADEPTTALDVTVQARVLQLIRSLQATHQMSVVFVTHDLSVAAQVADDVAIMYAGRLVEVGPVAQVLDAPTHPYTRGLVEANVRPGQKVAPRVIPGSPPNLAHVPPGCAFAPRCGEATAACWDAVPPLEAIAAQHAVRCINPVEAVTIDLDPVRPASLAG